MIRICFPFSRNCSFNAFEAYAKLSLKFIISLTCFNGNLLRRDFATTCYLRMSVVGKDTRALKSGDSEPAAPKNNTLRIYNMRFCPWAQRPMIYAAVKKLPVEIINIDLQNKPEWYFNKHYKGQVPCLEHDGKTIIESALIPEYLDEVFPQNRILPECPYEKAQQKIMVQRLGDVPMAFYGMVAALKDESLLSEKLDNLKKALNEAENLLKDGFYCGANPGFVDYLFYPNLERVYWITNISDKISLDSANFPCAKSYPKLTKWFSSMSQIPEVIEASQPKELGIGFIKGYIAGQPDYDYGL